MYIDIYVYAYLAVSNLYLSITFIQITHQGNFVYTPLGQALVGPPGPWWAGLCNGPSWDLIGWAVLGPTGHMGPPWALMGLAPTALLGIDGPVPNRLGSEGPPVVVEKWYHGR